MSRIEIIQTNNVISLSKTPLYNITPNESSTTSNKQYHNEDQKN